MARSLADLAGQQALNEQIPITLVYLGIDAPWGPLAVHDLDVDCYLNMTTNQVAMTPAAGFTKFTAAPDITVPELQESDEEAQPQVTMTMSNANQLFYNIVIADGYRERPFSIWQGNLTIGASLDVLTFIGVIKRYGGKIVDVQAPADVATIVGESKLTPQAMTWPYLTFDSTNYKFLPKPGTKIVWGYTVKTL
jgi:hypothetical protein